MLLGPPAAGKSSIQRLPPDQACEFVDRLASMV